MIYLIKVEYKDITLLKIGYTEDNNWEKRKTQYKLHNPLCEFLFNIEGGTEVMEKSLHISLEIIIIINMEMSGFTTMRVLQIISRTQL